MVTLFNVWYPLNSWGHLFNLYYIPFSILVTSLINLYLSNKFVNLFISLDYSLITLFNTSITLFNTLITISNAIFTIHMKWVVPEPFYRLTWKSQSRVDEPSNRKKSRNPESTLLNEICNLFFLLRKCLVKRPECGVHICSTVLNCGPYLSTDIPNNHWHTFWPRNSSGKEWHYTPHYQLLIFTPNI